MAAALAASLPAPSAAPAPAAPTYEAIPASMSKVIDLEGEIPLQSVQLDGLVGFDHLSSPRACFPSRRCSMGTFPGAVRVSIMAGHSAPTDNVQFHAAKGR